ncbi:dihydroorotase [Endothiovibrio diazotrophicus]
MRIRIHGGRIVDPAQGVDGVQDLYIVEEKVVALGAAPEGFVADREIDAGGRVVIPGVVDLAARLREPGQMEKADIVSESRAAVAAGITTVCIPPDTWPVIDEPAVVELIRRRAEQAGAARVVTLGALTQGLAGEHLAEMATLREAGCVGIGNARRPLANPQVLMRAMEYAASQGLTLFLDPEEPSLAGGGCAHQGAVASRMGLTAIPEAAETAAVARDLALIEQTGVRAHFGRLSSARAARMVERAREEGLPVSADVAAHQLFLTDEALEGFDANCHVTPPLRTRGDRQGLREALARGAVGVLCSDHQPHQPDAKLLPFPLTEPGISALETLLPLALRLVEEGVLTLSQAVARLSWEPAEVLGLPVGRLAPGAPADLCIFDPAARWRLRESAMVSRGRNTPFLGWEFAGRVTHTVVAGRLVYKAT